MIDYPKRWHFTPVYKDGSVVSKKQKDGSWKKTTQSKSKHPIGFSWQTKTSTTFPKGVPKKVNVGLQLGKNSGNTYSWDWDGKNFGMAMMRAMKVCIDDPDFDEDKRGKELTEIFEIMLTTTRFKSSPSRYQHLTIIENDSLAKLKIKATKGSATGMELELLANGQQTVIPPSICSKTGVYKSFKREWEILPCEIKTLTNYQFYLFWEWLKEQLTEPAVKKTFAPKVESFRTFSPISDELKDNLVFHLANSPMFKKSEDKDHTYHDELFNLSRYMYSYTMGESDCADIISGICELVRTAEDKDPSVIVHEAYSKGYRITYKDKSYIRGFLDIKPKGERYTLWEQLNKLLKKVSAAHAKRLALAAKITEDIVESKESVFQHALKDFDPNLRWFSTISDEKGKKKGEWRKFDETTGLWNLFGSLAVDDVLINWFDENHRSFSMYLSATITYIKPKRFENMELYNPAHLTLFKDLKVINSKTARIIDFDKEKHKFTQMVPRKIVEVDRFSKMIIDNLLNVVTTQKHVKHTFFPELDESVYQKKLLKQTLVNTLWGYQKDKVCLALIGPLSSAKSPVIKIMQKMLSDLAGSFRLQSLADNGGMATIIQKRLGTQDECNGGYWKPDAVSKFKLIESDVCKMVVKLLYKDPVEKELNIHLIVAANQLPKLPYDFETASTYKRFCILFCPNFFNKCKKLNAIFDSEEFLDIFFSYLLSYKPRTIIHNMEKWVKRNHMYYEWSSLPIERVVNKLYQRDYFEMNGIPTNDVWSEVETELKRLKIKIPKSLTDQICSAIVRLGGNLKRNKKISAGVTMVKGEDRPIFDYKDVFLGISHKEKIDLEDDWD